MIILKVTRNQGFTLSLEDTFFEKPQGGSICKKNIFLKKNIFEFNVEASGTQIGTKFASLYACIYMDEVETIFLKTQELQLLLWF